MIKEEVHIHAENIELSGELAIPDQAKGLVIFSHGSGSSRFSPRNNWVAGTLQKNGIATLLFDLLTAEEDQVYANRFDIDLLTNRLVAVTEWIAIQAETSHLNIGYFGASTGAASALNAAAILSKLVKTVVSRGGRPDLSIAVLDKVSASVLLIVGGLDTTVIELNKKAFDAMRCQKEFIIVPGATHLFEEPGKLEEVADLSAKWFATHL